MKTANAPVVEQYKSLRVVSLYSACVGRAAEVLRECKKWP